MIPIALWRRSALAVKSIPVILVLSLMTSACSATSADHPPLNLRRIQWSSVVIPGWPCRALGYVHLKDYSASVKHSSYGPESIGIVPPPSYGDVLGNGHDVAAVDVWCSNQGGTAAGQIANLYLVFSGESGKLRLIGTLRPGTSLPNAHPSFLLGAQISVGRIIATERWYRPDDSDCCPSGTTVMAWRWTGNHFVPAGH